MTTKILTLQSLLIEQLQDRYDAARQQATTYPQLKLAVTNPELAELIAQDIAANESHLQKLRDICQQLGATAEGEVCEGTQGLVHEAEVLLDDVQQDNVLDLAIAISIQHINHHDIAGYRSCQLFAQALQESQVAEALGVMLKDERNTDHELESMIQQLIKIQS